MPSPYTIAHGMIGVHKNTTVANAVDEIDFDRSCSIVRIITNMADDLYVTTDGSVPTVAGANCHRVPAGTGVVTIDLEVFGKGQTVIKVISASPVVYSVEGAL